MSLCGFEINMVNTLKCVWQCNSSLGEGPVWCSKTGTLFFVDIKSPSILNWHPNGASKIFPMPSEIGSIALRKDGGLVAALRRGLAFVELNPLTVEFLPLSTHEPKENRFNDGKCDSKGRFWIATMDDGCRQPLGAIWRLSEDLHLERIDTGYIVGNGFGWSPDGQTMYFTDSENRKILAYPFDPITGSLGERRCFATIPTSAGYPDGLAVDVEGCVWSAHWDGSRITRYRPNGSIDRVILMPVPRPTSLAFGGDDLGKLYVTSASIGLSVEQLADSPLSGGLFEMDSDTQGLQVARFGG